MDKKIYLHEEEGNQIWFVGFFETDTFKVRLDVINDRIIYSLKFLY